MREGVEVLLLQLVSNADQNHNDCGTQSEGNGVYDRDGFGYHSSD